MPEENNNNKNKKWRSRRLIIATIAWLAISLFAIYCLEKSADIEWFKTYTLATVSLALFGIGALTATDMLDRWKS